MGVFSDWHGFCLRVEVADVRHFCAANYDPEGVLCSLQVGPASAAFEVQPLLASCTEYRYASAKVLFTNRALIGAWLGLL